MSAPLEVPAALVPPPSKMTITAWLICILASIGFAFDIYELLMLPLVLPPAIPELGGFKPGTPEFSTWVSLFFFVPAFVGGIFGLLGGYLTDRYGRRTVLTYSILLYAVSAFLAGYSTSLTMFLILRCTTFIGVCVEFVAAVAWLAELFPNPQQRERVLGYTQAFSSIGGLLVAVVNGLVLHYAKELPAIGLPEALMGMFGGKIADPHAAWRYTLMSGLIPAIPLIVIRPFLPESPLWKAKKDAGTLKRPSIAALFSPQLARTTIVTTIMFACSYGAAFGAIQQLTQIVPGLPEVKAQVAQVEKVPEKKKLEQKAAANYTKVQEVGGLVGRFVFALIAAWAITRGNMLRIFIVPGMIILPIVFYGFAQGENRVLFDLQGFPFTLLHLGIFVVGFFTVAQFSFWGNYLPQVYPLHLRGTGESFAANIGGRMIGTSFAAISSMLSNQAFMPGTGHPMKLAYTAMFVGLFVYVVGFISSFFLPEPDASTQND
jgi:MFS family permease